MFFKLSHPRGNLCGGGVTILNPKYPRLSSGDTMIHIIIILPMWSKQKMNKNNIKITVYENRHLIMTILFKNLTFTVWLILIWEIHWPTSLSYLQSRTKSTC